MDIFESISQTGKLRFTEAKHLTEVVRWLSWNLDPELGFSP